MSRPSDWRDYLSQPQTAEDDYLLPVVALDRPEGDPCERGTVGCSVAHGASRWEHACQTW